MTPSDVKVLTLRGGGVKGAAYVGAVQALHAAGIRPTSYVGTSAGAIAAGVLAMGLDARGLRDVLHAAPFKTFAKDGGGIFEGLGDAWRLWRHHGLNSGDGLGRWLDGIFGQKRFVDLQFDLEVWTWDIGERRPESFSRRATPLMSVSRAVRASAAIPGYFTPVIINGRPLWDGGLAVNDPLIMQTSLRQPHQVVALAVQGLPGAQRPGGAQRAGLRWLLDALGKGLTEASEAAAWEALADAWKARHVSIPCGDVSSTDWNIGADALARLELAGRVAVERWLEKVR